MTETPFDEIKAIKEELSGVSDVIAVLAVRKQAAEQTMVEAEDEFNALTKLYHFAKEELDRKKKVLRRLEEANK